MPIPATDWEPISSAPDNSDWEPAQPNQSDWEAIPSAKPMGKLTQFLPSKNIGPESTISGGTRGGGLKLTPFTKNDLPDAQSVHEVLDDISSNKGLETVLPTATVNPNDSVLTGIGKEAYNLAAGIPKFAASPIGVATAGLGTVVKPTLIAGGFAADMLKNLGEQIKTNYKNWDQMTPGQKAGAITDMVGTGAFAGLLGHSAIKGFTANAKPQNAPETPIQPPEPSNATPEPSVASPEPPAAAIADTGIPEPVRETGVQPAAAEKPTLQPAIKIGDKIYSGGGVKHANVLLAHAFEQPDGGAGLLSTPEADLEAGRGFIDQNGKFYTRAEALKTGVFPDGTVRATSEDLPGFDENAPPPPTKVTQVEPDVHGGAQEDLQPEQQAISKANNSREAFMRVQAEADAKKLAQTAPTGDKWQDALNEFQKAAYGKKHSPTAIAGAVTPKNAPEPVLSESVPAQSKFRVGNSPQLHSVVEKLPATPVEIANGEQPIRVRNDKTGEEQIVNESDLTQVTAKPAVDKLAQVSKSKALDDQLKSLKLDPSVFKNAEQKRAAIKRAKALFGEGPGAATAGSDEFTGGNREVSGLAVRVREQRESAGMTDATSPGAGIAPEASVERGKQLLAAGADAEKILKDFEATKRFSSDDIAIVRAHQDRLARDTNVAEEQFGTDSPEYREAYDRESSWSARTKTIQTEWAKSGHAQQGDVDIDTGTFSGLKRAYRDAHDGEEMPKVDEKKAKEFADESKKLTDESKDLLNEVGDVIEKEPEDQSPQEKVASEAEKRAIAAAHKTVREAAARLSKAESKTRVERTVGKRNIAKTQEEVARKALAVANETVREAAARAAERENKLRVAAAAKKQILGTLPFTKTEFFKYKGGKMTADQVRALWTYAKKNYIDKGSDNFTEIVGKVATDLGLKFADVAEGLSQPKSVRKITDELWRKQTDARRISEAAKQWVRQVNSPILGRILPSAARRMFGLRVFGHGTVAFGTHAPLVGFMPKYWNNYFRDFGKMYQMVWSKSQYEKNVQALRADPNYTVAGRAGLVNDPYKVEDFNNPDMAQYFGRLSGAGNRGYFALKVLRQDMFNQGWDKLPETLKTPEMAKAMATDINHITGVVKSSLGNKASLALFAPRLLMSRVAFLAGDPYKAVEIASTAMTPARWKALPPEQKFQVINQVKQKATILGVAYGLLLANQALLSATGSKQKINLSDPTRSDFWKFKAAGMDFSYGNAMLNMARLPIRMWTIGAGDGGKLKHVIYPDESMYSAFGEFARSQASPLASLGLDLVFKGDYQNRPLPQIPGYGKPIPMPRRLKDQGIKPYTWTEFIAEQASPIPLQEAEREVWRTGLGLSPAQQKQILKAAGTTIVMMATGGRLSEDIPYKKK